MANRTNPNTSENHQILSRKGRKMDKRISFTLFLALALAIVSLAAEDTWTQKADMPTARSCLSTSVVDGKIYAIGGIINATSAALSIVEEYDSRTDTWSTRTNMPTARSTHGAGVVGGKVCVIGGAQTILGSGLSTVEEYDPVSDTWTTKADMPTARRCLSATEVNGKIYAIGGKPAQAAAPLKTVEEYDPATDTWTRKAPMPTARTGLSTCAVNGKIYAIGGGLELLSTSGLSTVEEYDPVTDTWTTKADMPIRRFVFASSAVNNKIYAIGGAVTPWKSWEACPTVEEYDPNPLVVDFNGDFKVDFEDFSILAQCWYNDQSPFVNHTVDCEDLADLAEYWLLEFGLVAHWKLDETEGGVAHDSIGGEDAFGPTDLLWRPQGGKIGGALELDGIDDLLFTTFSLNPADTSFSVFAWVKGGAPGQVIISQSGGANWLVANPADGTLMTELGGSGRFDGPLYSQTVITDGDWHRAGITWDGSNRILYVDDVEVARDTQAGLAASTGGLYFGAGENPVPPSLWLGLLDDIRIYDRAIVP